MLTVNWVSHTVVITTHIQAVGLQMACQSKVYRNQPCAAPAPYQTIQSRFMAHIKTSPAATNCCILCQLPCGKTITTGRASAGTAMCGLTPAFGSVSHN